MSTTLELIRGPMPDTPEWHAARKQHITATDVAAILGQSDYKTPLDVFLEKTGRVAPFEGNVHTRRGKRYEGPILDDYAEDQAVTLEWPMPLLIHSTMAFLAATPDARRVSDGNLVEAKFSMSAARAAELGDEGTDAVPTDWLLQTQTQMAVSGAEFVDIAVLLYGRLRVYHVERNADLIGIIEAAAGEMHARILADDPPEPDYAHARARETINLLNGSKADGLVVLDDTLCELWAERQALKETIKRDETRVAEIDARVLHALGEAAAGAMPGSSYEISRSITRETYWTNADVDAARANLGQIKRRSYVTLRQRKAK